MRTLTAHSFVTTFATRVVSAALGIATGILIARALGPQGKGALAAAQLMVGIAVTLASGVGSALTYYITKKAIRPAELLIPLGITFAIVSCVTTVAFAATLFVRGWSPIVFTAMLAAPAGIALGWQTGYFAALGSLASLNLQAAGTALLALAAAAVALRLGTGINGVLTAWSLATVVAGSIFTVQAVREAGGIRRSRILEKVRDLSVFGLQSSGNSFLGWLTYRIDAVLIAAFLGIYAFGVYSVAVNVSEVLLLVSRSVTTVLTREIGSRQRSESAELSARAIRTVTWLLCVIAVAAWFAVPLIVHAVYGSRFDAATLPFHLLLPGIVAFGAVGTFCAFFIFQLGRPGIVTALNAVTIGVQAVLCAALIPRGGLAGAALASTITYVVGAIYCTAYFCRVSEFAPLSLWLLRRSDATALLSALRRRRAVAPPADAKPLLLVTGAAGKIGTLLRPSLREHYRLRLCDKIAFGDLQPGETFLRFDLLNARLTRAAVRGVDAILHLGAIGDDAGYADHERSTMRATYVLLEAARREGVRRVVLASTGHVTGYYCKTERVDGEVRTRPDSLYGAAKVLCEALASLYADKFGLQVFSIRIGHCVSIPSGALDRAIWISPRDLCRLVRIGVEHPEVRNDVVYGVSRNSESWWENSRAEALGYEPLDSADGVRHETDQAASPFQGDYRAERDLLAAAER